MTNHSDKSKRLLPDSKKLADRAQAAAVEATFEVFSSVNSTQIYLLDQPVAMLTHGRSVLAGVQTAGRGRLERIWSTGEGEGLLLSTVVQLPLNDARLEVLPMAVGVAAIEALAPYVPQAQLKWPNDVVVAAPSGLLKLGGIVIALHADATANSVCVVGIGLNVDMSAHSRPVENARAISDFSHDLPELDALVVEVIGRLHQLLELAPGKIHELYVQKSCTLGKTVTVTMANGERCDGEVVAIAPDGAIEVKSGNVTQTFRTADIEHLITA